MRFIKTVAFLSVWLHIGLLMAHSPTPSRRMVVQFDEKGAAVLWSMQIAGELVPLLKASRDLDGNRTLSLAEEQALAQGLIGKAMRGIRIRLNERPLPIRMIETHKLGQGTNAVEAFALSDLVLPDLRDENVHQLAVSTTKTTGPVELQIQTLDNWRFVQSSAGKVAADKQGLESFVTMKPGASVNAKLIRLR